MSSAFSYAAQSNGSLQTNNYTLTGLRRWSAIDKELPKVDQIKHLHIYDFDNTLFCSPLPNKTLWHGPGIGMLQTQETFANGGWWHDVNILAATGEGVEKEEPRAWEGWWNEQIVNLVELSMQQKDALTVLLTGRGETRFTDLLHRMVKAKKLEFDMLCLKPEVGPNQQKFASTMKYKQALLNDIVYTYKDADEIRIYEDRPKHVNGFRTYLTDLNNSFNGSIPASRKPIKGEVIEVSDMQTELDPTEEIAQVQRMINTHNIAVRDGTFTGRSKTYELKKNIIFTGYMVSPQDTAKLLTLGNIPKSGEYSYDVRTLANSIMIAPYQANPRILSRAGGMGHQVRWRVTSVGNWEKSVWAARVEPSPPSQQVFTESLPATIVLAVRRNARPQDARSIQSWENLSADKQFEFDTYVGEKVTVRIDEEREPEADSQRNIKRPRLDNDEFPPLGAQRNGEPGGDSRQRSNYNGDNRRTSGNVSNNQKNGSQRNRGGGGGGPSSRSDNRAQGRNGGGRGGFGRGGGGGGGGGGSHRGRGGRGGYRSLDDDPTYRSGKSGGYGMDGSNEDGGLTY